METHKKRVSFVTGSRIIIIYRERSHDAYVAAFTLYLHLNEEHKNVLECYSSSEKQLPTNIGEDAVFILGVGYSLDIYKEIMKKTKNFLVIDNHDSSENILIELPKENRIYNKNESISMLAWKFNYSNLEPPLLYKYIKSRALFLKPGDKEYIPNADNFEAAFDLVIRGDDGNYSFKNTEKYLNDVEINGLIFIGRVATEYRRSIIEKIISTTSFCPIKLKDGTMTIVAYINSPVLQTDIGYWCMKEYKFVDFCAIYHVNSARQTTTFELRSSDTKHNVANIALEHGGSGRHNASKFTINGVDSRLKYEHLDPLPLFCVFNDETLKIDSLNVLQKDYINLIKRKFPGKKLKIEFNVISEEEEFMQSE